MRVVRCSGCKFIYVNPQPTEQELRTVYAQEYYPANPSDVRRALESRLPVFQHGIAKLRKLRQPGRLLDQGCGTGDFVEIAQRAGWDAMGIDLSESAVNFAAGKGLKVELGSLDSKKYAAESFDAVTLWDVLEHLPSPCTAIGQIYRILRPGGLLLVRVPNTNFQLMKAFLRESLLRGSHDSLQANLHLNHFAPATLRRLLIAQGFEILEEEAGISEDKIFRQEVPLSVKKVYCRFARALQAVTSFQIGPTMVFYARKSRHTAGAIPIAAFTQGSEAEGA